LLREPAQRDLELGGAGGRPDLGGPVREFGERQLPAADHRLELLLGDGAGAVVWLLRPRGPSPVMTVTRSAVRSSVRSCGRPEVACAIRAGFRVWITQPPPTSRITAFRGRRRAASRFTSNDRRADSGSQAASTWARSAAAPPRGPSTSSRSNSWRIR